MRISDWSSDVCSSDLLVRDQRAVVDTQRSQGKARLRPRFFLELAVLGGMDGRPYATVPCRSAQREFSRQRVSSADCPGATRPATRARPGIPDRKRAVWGKSESVRVDLGGCGCIQKKKK